MIIKSSSNQYQYHNMFKITIPYIVVYTLYTVNSVRRTLYAVHCTPYSIRRTAYAKNDFKHVFGIDSSSIL